MGSTKKKKKATEEKWTLLFPTWLRIPLFLPFAGRDCPDSFRIKWELSHTAALVLQANSKNGDTLRMDGVLLPVCPGGGSKPSSIPMDREKGSEFDAAFRKTFPTHF